MGLNDIPMNPNAYETAKWFFNERQFKLIKVEQISDTEKRFSHTIQNLITDAGNTVLKTRYANDYKINQKIFYRDKYWSIRGTASNTSDLAPQLLGITKPQVEYILEIIEADKETVYHA